VTHVTSVLIVDDDATLAQSIGAHLTQQGFDVDVVNSTFAALDRLDQRKFTVIIADIAMPRGMPNGVSLLRMARIRDSACHVMLITGYTDLARDGELFGARVFTKPIDLDALTAGIRKGIAASESRRTD
jgi:DNA-binding response OmpR family regulator